MIETFTLISFFIVIYDYLFQIQKRNRVFFSFLFFLIFFESTKWKFGVDWLPYFQFFNSSKDLILLTAISTQVFEPGFVFINYIVRNLTDQYTFLLTLVMVLLYVPLFTSVFFHTNKSFLSIFYLVSTIPWYSGSLRQMVAIGVFALAINMIIKRKIISFFLLIFIASLFHSSAIPLIFSYFLYGISWGIFLIIFIFFLGLGIFADKLVQLLDYIFSQLGRRSDYSSKISANPNANPLLGLSRKIYYLFGFYIFYYSASANFINSKNEDLKKLNFFLMLSTFTLWAYLVGTYKVVYFNSRMDIYFSLISGAYLIGILENS